MERTMNLSEMVTMTTNLAKEISQRVFKECEDSGFGPAATMVVMSQALSMLAVAAVPVDPEIDFEETMNHTLDRTVETAKKMALKNRQSWVDLVNAESKGTMQ